MKNEIFSRDLLASVVVFLVALPLCLGIAIASGVPPILGVISGIIGGLVIAPFAGVSLQVSGPAAGLAVMVFQFVEKFGLQGLVWLGLIIGALQFVAGLLKVGDYFRATSPALIKGMLGGIGLLILVSQLLVGLEFEPTSSGLENMAVLPEALMGAWTQHQHALWLLLVSVGVIYFWGRLPSKISSKLPASLAGVVLATLLADLFYTDVQFITLPEKVLDGMNFVSLNSLGLFSFDLVVMALGMALVASAETLLSAVAADKMAEKTSSDYNKELRAQGLGNFAAGLLGALPMTGVIVRTTANIEAGGRSRFAAIFHGIWLMLFVFGLPWVLNYIPVGGLAAILIVTGWKLLDLKSIPMLWRKDKLDFLVYIVTIGCVVGVDLLTGVVAGFVVSIMILAFKVSHLEILSQEIEGTTSLTFKGSASFIAIPKISKALNKVESQRLSINLTDLSFKDAAVDEQIANWSKVAKSAGRDVRVICR